MTVDINLFASVARASNTIYLYTKLDDDLQTITAPGYFNSKDLSGAVKVGDIILVNARDKFAVLKVIEVKVLSGEITVVQAFSEGGVVPPEPTPEPTEPPEEVLKYAWQNGMGTGTRTLWTDSEIPAQGDPMYSSPRNESSIWAYVNSVTEDGEGNLILDSDFVRAEYADYHQDDLLVFVETQVQGATFTLNGLPTSRITAKEGDEVTYTVSKQDWVPVEGTQIVEDTYGNGECDIYVHMEPTADAKATLYVNLENGSDYQNIDVQFTCNDPEAIIDGRSINAHLGSEITYEITAGDAETINSETVNLTDNDIYAWMYLRPSGTLYAYANTWTPGIPYQYVYTDTQTPSVGDSIMDENGSVIGRITSRYSGAGVCTTLYAEPSGSESSYGYDRSAYHDILPLAPTQVQVHLESIPGRATKYLNGTETTSITAAPGDVVTYEASLTNWTSATGTYTVLPNEENQYINAELTPGPDSTLLLTVSVEDYQSLTNFNLTFTTDDPDPSTNGGTIEVKYGSTVNYTITADGMETFTSVACELNEDDRYANIAMRPSGTLYAYKAYDFDQNPPLGPELYTLTQTPQAGDSVYDNQGTSIGTIDSVLTWAGLVHVVSILGQDGGHEYTREPVNDVIPSTP